jgi:hypothetical protein
MADSAVAITAGSGTNVDTYQLTGGDHQQVVREARALTETDDSWTVTTAGQASQIAANAARVFVMMVSQANGRVYLRFDSTVPTAAAFHWYLDPDERWELPPHLSTLAISMLGAVAGGTILTHLGVAG